MGHQLPWSTSVFDLSSMWRNQKQKLHTMRHLNLATLVVAKILEIGLLSGVVPNPIKPSVLHSAPESKPAVSVLMGVIKFPLL